MEKEPKPPKPKEPQKWEAFHVWKTAEQWSRDGHCVVTLKVLQARLDQGWTIRQAMEIPASQEEVNG